MEYFFIFVLCLTVFTVRCKRVEVCDNCLLVEDCRTVGELTRSEQDTWRIEHACEKNKGDDDEEVRTLFGFAPYAKGDYVCCPNKIIKSGTYSSDNNQTPTQQNRHGQSSRNDQRIQNNQHQTQERPTNQNQQFNTNFENNRRPDNGFSQSRPVNDYNNQANGQQNLNNNNRGFQSYPNYGTNNNGRMTHEPLMETPGNNFPQANVCQRIISTPPEPDSGCCGIDNVGTGGNNAAPNNNFAQQYPGNFNNMPSQYSNVNPSMGGWPSWFPKPFNFFSSRAKRSNENETVPVSIDNRITGGKITPLGQFPWLVYLLTTFSNSDSESTFKCGGSLISSSFVLTAGHCMYDEKSRVKEIEVTLAEHDTRTYPEDCSYEDEGRKCIENIKMLAANYFLHPNYDDNRLQNDIGLIKLDGIAPYRDTIRPICLPPNDIDWPNYANMRLYIAGWGRDGRHVTFIKQSAIVNLVPQNECKREYSFLTRRHVCASGYAGQDTCPGDSGGPLMMLHEGRYYVSGIVSGKRADVPCGSSTPSLYTNVYNYLDWIRGVVKNG